MTIKVCSKCQATFIDGQLYWSGTGALGDPRDLAGLVCRPFGDANCINPMRNVEGGDTWAKRQEFIDNTPF
jgi:hypothetical protein